MSRREAVKGLAVPLPAPDGCGLRDFRAGLDETGPTRIIADREQTRVHVRNSGPPNAGCVSVSCVPLRPSVGLVVIVSEAGSGPPVRVQVPLPRGRVGRWVLKQQGDRSPTPRGRGGSPACSELAVVC